jgi:hypothetical protein
MPDTKYEQTADPMSAIQFTFDGVTQSPMLRQPAGAFVCSGHIEYCAQSRQVAGILCCRAFDDAPCPQYGGKRLVDAMQGLA